MFLRRVILFSWSCFDAVHFIAWAMVLANRFNQE